MVLPDRRPQSSSTVVNELPVTDLGPELTTPDRIRSGETRTLPILRNILSNLESVSDFNSFEKRMVIILPLMTSYLDKFVTDLYKNDIGSGMLLPEVFQTLIEKIEKFSSLDDQEKKYKSFLNQCREKLVRVDTSGHRMITTRSIIQKAVENIDNYIGKISYEEKNNLVNNQFFVELQRYQDRVIRQAEEYLVTVEDKNKKSQIENKIREIRVKQNRPLLRRGIVTSLLRLINDN